MAGSYSHVTTEDGKLRGNESFLDLIENLGDAYEATEEMYGMIWWLASGRAGRVEEARNHYREGLAVSPGIEDE